MSAEDALDPDDESADASAPRSRTEQTRAAAAVNRLGLQLTSLAPGELDRIELPERIRQEIEVWRKLPARSRGRQNRLIGQLLRAEDHEAIRERFDQLKRSHREGVHHEKLNEVWIERLSAEGDAAVEALIEEYPGADRQRMRALTRVLRKDPASKAAKRARRELLRTVRALRA